MYVCKYKYTEYTAVLLVSSSLLTLVGLLYNSFLIDSSEYFQYRVYSDATDT